MARTLLHAPIVPPSVRLTRSQRETAVAHSSAAWARLKDVFTLSDSHVEIIDSDNSAGHKFKEGWNNGTLLFSSPQPHALKLKRGRPQVFGVFATRCAGSLKNEKSRTRKKGFKRSCQTRGRRMCRVH